MQCEYSFCSSDYVSGGQDVWIEQADEVTHSMNAQSVLIAAGNKWQGWVVISVLLLVVIELEDFWRHRTFKAVPPWADPASAWGPLLVQQWNQYGLGALTRACNYLHGIKAVVLLQIVLAFRPDVLWINLLREDIALFYISRSREQGNNAHKPGYSFRVRFLFLAHI